MTPTPAWRWVPAAAGLEDRSCRGAAVGGGACSTVCQSFLSGVMIAASIFLSA